jgi:hypothetical protein
VIQLEFDYNFDNCFICGLEINFDEEDECLGECPSGCCSIDVDPQGETVDVTFFNRETHFILLCEDSVNKRYTRSNINWDEKLEKFLIAIEWWKNKSKDS